MDMKYTIYMLWLSCSPYSYTPLMEAAREGHEDVVALLIEQGNIQYGMLLSTLNLTQQVLTLMLKLMRHRKQL